VLKLKVNFSKADTGTVTLPLDSDITWNGFLKALEQEFAVPVDLLQLYSSSDEERECNYLDYVTEKDKKLVELAGLQEDSQYEMDLELPSADSNEPSRITVVSGGCTILAHNRKAMELNESGSPYRIRLENSGFRSKKAKGKKLKVVTKSSEEGYQFKQYRIPDEPKSRVEIEMKDMENPTVTLVQIQNRSSHVIDFEVDDFLHNTQPLSARKVAEEVAVGTLNLFTFITSFA